MNSWMNRFKNRLIGKLCRGVEDEWVNKYIQYNKIINIFNVTLTHKRF